MAKKQCLLLSGICLLFILLFTITPLRAETGPGFEQRQLNEELSAAIQKNQREIAEQLLKKGANPNCFCKNDYLTAYHHAIILNDPKIIKIINDSCSTFEPELRNSRGSFGLAEQIYVILKIRRALRKGEHTGNEPIDPEKESATISKRLEGTVNLTKFLLASNLNSFNGSTEVIDLIQQSLTLALNSIDTEMAELLLANGAKIEESQTVSLDPDFFYSSTQAAKPRILSAFETFLDFLKSHGISINVSGEVNHVKHISLLLQVIVINESLSPKLAEILIKRGANLFRTDADGNTALHFAVLKRNAGAVKLLLDAGAFADTKNLKGLTPLGLTYSKKDPSIPDTEIETLLRKSNASYPVGFSKLYLNYSHVVLIFSALCALLTIILMVKGNPGTAWSMLAISLTGFCWYYAMDAMELFKGSSNNCWSSFELRPGGFTWSRPDNSLRAMLPATPASAALDPATVSLLVLSVITSFLGWEKQNNRLRWAGCAFAALPFLMLAIWLTSSTFPGMAGWFFAICALFAISRLANEKPVAGWNAVIVGLTGFAWWLFGVAEKGGYGPQELVFDPALLSFFGLSLIATFLRYKESENSGRWAKNSYLWAAVFLGMILPFVVWLHNLQPTLLF